MSYEKIAEELDTKLHQALSGVKVLELAWALVGALTGKQLADHGAIVVRIESRKRLDFARLDKRNNSAEANNVDDKPSFCYYNTSKYGLTLDLKHPQSREVIDRLISWADVVTENFTPGTVKKLNLDYEYMKSKKPDIIMLSGSVYGQTGPLSRTWGIDGTGSALSGRADLTGWPDREPTIPSVVPYGDHVLPIFNALAIVAALDYKRRTGRGQYIDASMFDVCVQQIAPALFDWEANRHLQSRSGNRIPGAAPHGVFPCLGEDRWCAIAVFTEEEWKGFCNVLGNSTWVNRPEFQSLSLRKQNEDELEKLIADWTMNYPAEEIMQKMQASGVAAGVVQNARDLVENDPQLRHRGFIKQIYHPVLGTFGHPTPAYKFSKTKAQLRSAPCLGEHTECVCTRLLGMSDEEFINLFLNDVFQ